MPTLEAVRRDALALSNEDRQLLAFDLAMSVDEDANYNVAWRSELKRRIESPEDDALEWEEARLEIFGPEE